MLRRHSLSAAPQNLSAVSTCLATTESRDGLKALGAQRHHYINLARAENRVAGLSDGERGTADEQQLGLLVVMQKIEQAAFNEAVRNGMSPGDAVREVARRMDAFASLITSSPVLEIR